MKIDIYDVLIYRGDIWRCEKDRYQIVTRIDNINNFFTKFTDTGDLNIINTNSDYFRLCDIVPKEKHKLSLKNGIPLVWGDED
jgi:hypothetical protein